MGRIGELCLGRQNTKGASGIISTCPPLIQAGGVLTGYINSRVTAQALIWILTFKVMVSRIGMAFISFLLGLNMVV